MATEGQIIIRDTEAIAGTIDSIEGSIAKLVEDTIVGIDATAMLETVGSTVTTEGICKEDTGVPLIVEAADRLGDVISSADRTFRDSTTNSHVARDGAVAFRIV